MEQENNRSQSETAGEFMARKKEQATAAWQRQKGNVWRWTKRIVLGAVVLVALFYLAVLISAWI